MTGRDAAFEALDLARHSRPSSTGGASRSESACRQAYLRLNKLGIEQSPALRTPGFGQAGEVVAARQAMARRVLAA